MRYTSELPAQSRLIELIDYNPTTGVFVWRKRLPEDFQFNQFPEACAKQFNARYAGQKTFNTLINPDVPKYGYQGVIERRAYLAGRVAWKIFHGTDPQEVTAINGDLRNTRIDSLMDATTSVVHRTTSVHLNNSSGVRGVYWNKEKNKWQAQIQVNGKVIPLGRYDDLNDAAAARLAAEKRFGFGRIAA